MTAIAEALSLPEHLLPDASAALGRALGDLPEIGSLRAAAAQIASEKTPPTRVDRPWRYTEYGVLSLDARRPSLPARSGPLQAPAGEALEIVDGEIVTTGPAGSIVVAPLSESEKGLSHARLVGTAVRPDFDLATALHYGFMETPILIGVPDDEEAGEAIRISRSFSQPDGLAAPHTLIVTGRNARVTVIEDYRSNQSPMTVLPAVEIFPGPGALVRYMALHRWGSETAVFSSQRNVTGGDSSVSTVFVVTGGASVKSHIASSLEGRGSASEILGLFAGRGSQHFDLYTVQDHVAADTRSDLLYKSALHDEARSVYYGLTRVGLEARNADANQENRNLLLSGKAKADSDPVLEILTSDVIRAAHGATAGPVDAEQLFYLEARGIPRPVAEELIVTGFLGGVLDRIPDPKLRRELAAAVDLHLEDVQL